MISFRRIYKSFGPAEVLCDVSLDVMDGEIFFVIGASGVGKSVLIKQLVGLLSPDRGEVWLDGEEISGFDEARMFGVRRKCAMVFQHSTLFDSMTCLDNVALPLRKHRRLRPTEARALAVERLEQVGMQDFGTRYPAELSDGMRKRVAIARALTLDPRYVLFDEPTTGLDLVSARRVDALIADLSRRLGVTSIVVSHDLKSIFGIATRIAMLYKAHIRMVGTPDELKASPDEVVRQFIEGRASGPMETQDEVELSKKWASVPSRSR
jgi:phospholipid/cholesterol/gamma-HCH transport system ATP-binding protein